METLISTPAIDAYCADVNSLFKDWATGDLVYRGMTDLIAKIGERYIPTPWASFKEKGYERGQLKLCFANSFNLATSHDDLTYVEGLAYSGFFPVHHAWCVTAEGEVVDPTWREEKFNQVGVTDWEYVGVPLTDEFICQSAVKRRIYGILDNPLIYKDGLPDTAFARQ